MLRRPPSLMTHFAALLGSAVLLALSYPLPGWGFLAWVALVPAGWLAATARSPWRLVWTSTLVFALWWVWMLRWLWPVTLPGALATAVFQSLFWVVALWATNACVRRQRVPVAAALPLCWVSLEYVRCVWPWGGFAWFTLAQTQADPMSAHRSFAAGSAILWGAWFSSFAVVVTNGLVIRVPDYLLRPKPTEKLRIWLLALSLVSVFVLVGGALSRSPVESDHETVQISVVQTNSPHSNKLMPTLDSYEADFAELARLHAEASGEIGGDDVSTSRDREGAGPGDRNTGDARSLTVAARPTWPALIVWPETTVPGKFNDAAAAMWVNWANSPYNDGPDAALHRVRYGMPSRAQALIAQHGVPTVVGGSTYLETDDPRDPVEFNSAYLVDSGGAIVDRYDKMHRVPFGEYIPLPEGLKAWVLSTVSPYDFDYSIDAGTAATVFEVAGSSVGQASRLSTGETPAPPERKTLRFATPICFEDTNAALCRSMVYDPETGAKRVDALVNLTTNGWFGRLPSDEHPGGGLAWRDMRYQHLQLASLRAIENRVPVVRSVNTGVSAVIDSTGRIVAAAEPGEAAVLRAELVLDSRRTLYAAVGDWPVRALAVATLGLVAWARVARPGVVRRRRRRGG